MRIQTCFAAYLICSLFIGVNEAYACKFHANFSGGFGYGHSPMQPITNPVPEPESSTVSIAKLTTPHMIAGKIGKPLAIDIGYELLNLESKSSLELSISADASIIVENPLKSGLSNSTGQHQFTLVPQKAGTFKINIVAIATNKGDSQIIHSTAYASIR